MEDTDNLSSAVQRRRLRAELRRARLDAGLTQEQAAAEMEWSLSKLIRIENGSVGVSANDLKALLQLYKITDDKRAAELLVFARASRERSWWSTQQNSMSRQLIQLIEFENAADASRHYQDLVIPGLLQTPDYMRASARQLEPGWKDEQIESVVETRLKRQQLLTRADVPLLFFVMDEAVVRRFVGTNEVMIGQLQRLIEAASTPKVTVEVIPFSAGLLPGLQAPFVIHEFPDAEDGDVLYLENPRGDLITKDDPEEIIEYRENFDRMRRESLGPAGTIDFLHELIGALR